MAMEAVRVEGGWARAPFRTLSVHEARALLLYGIERRHPVQLVIGRAGSGKSRLLGALSRTALEGAEFVLVRDAPVTVEGTTAMLASRFGVADRLGESPLERLARLAGVLAERRRAGRLVAVLLDDAHLLPIETLLNVRLLAGTDAAGGALLPIVMAGRPELLAAMDTPGLEPLRLGIAAHVELRRPLPATEVDDQEAEDETKTPSHVERGRRRRWVRAALPIAGVVAATVLLTRSARMPAPGGARRAPEPTVATPPVAGAATGPEAVLTAAPDVTLDLPPDLSAGRLTAAGVRILVAELGVALASRDLVRLERIFARDVRQNGVRGREAILDSYAYRFTRLDAPISIAVPDRITLRDGSALAEVPFDTAYRDAGGNVGTVAGTLRLRVGRHDGRAVVDALDWAFAGATP